MKYFCHKPSDKEIDAYIDALEIRLKSGWSFSVSSSHSGLTLSKKTAWVLQDRRYKELSIKYKTPQKARLYDVSRGC